MAGMRDIVVHQYFGVDLEFVWLATFTYEIYQGRLGITVYFCNVRMLLRSPDLEPFHNAKISVV